MSPGSISTAARPRLSAITRQLLTNLENIAESAGGDVALGAGMIDQLFTNFSSPLFMTNLGGALGGAFGTLLGSQVLAPTNQDGALGSQIGSTLGGDIGGILGQGLIPIPGLGMIIGDFIGSFVGDVLGTLFGDLFGDDGPPTASMTLGIQNGQLGVINVSSDNGGSSGAFQPIATAVDNTVNGLIGMTGAQLSLAQPSNDSGGLFGAVFGELTGAVPSALTVLTVSLARLPSALNAATSVEVEPSALCVTVVFVA
jgi:hypothetical protein